MKLLPELLQPQGAQGFRGGHYAFSTTGGTRLGFSRASVAVGIDVPTVATQVRRRVDAFIASQSGPAASAREGVLLSVLALLDMMTSNDERRLVLAGRDAHLVAAYCAAHALDVRLLPHGESAASPVESGEHTLLALDLPLGEVAEYARHPQAKKGIVIAAGGDHDADRSVVSGFPNPVDRIATGVDLGSGVTDAWLWPRL